MNSEQAKYKSAKPACLTLLVLFVGLPMLAIAGILLWYTSRQSQAEKQLNQEVADLRASGLPVDNQTLAEYYESLTDRERTSQWLRILEQLESAGFAESAQNMPFLGEGGTEDVPLPGEPWGQQKEVEAFLQSQQVLLADLHDAASESGAVWYPTKFDSFETLLPYVHASRQPARLLQLEHHAAVHAGDGERAAESLRSLFGLTETLQGEPFIVSQLIRIAIHSVAIDALQRSIEQDVLDEEVLVDLLERLRGFDDYRTPYRTAIVGERAAALPVFQNPGRIQDAPFIVGSRPRDALAALDFYERMERVAEEEDLDAFMQASAQLNADMQAELSSAGALQKYETALTQLILPASDAFALAVARQVVRSRLARLGVGLRSYQRHFGEWPERLDNLGEFGLDPAVLVPMGGKPFGYRVEEGTAVLWGFEPVAFSEDGSAPTAVPENPPPLEDPSEPFNEPWVWRLVP